MDLAKASALDTAAAVRAGEITALEVCEAAIARIEARDGPINAVVIRDFDRARDAARQIDRSRSSDDPRPLLGVAMTLKESNDVAGLETTWGLEGFRDTIAERDADVTARLKAAGAVIVGKTNVPVSLADWQSDNPIHGRTVNPLDPGRTPGGSSGGAAAALVSGMTPIEIGSDIGGSIRVPAHFCGQFGHKPTYGVVSGRGHEFPGTDGVPTPLAVVGPMARTATDLAAVMEVVAGPDVPGWALDLPPDRCNALAGCRVHMLRHHPVAAVDPAITAVMDALSDRLVEAGAILVDDCALPDLETMHKSYIAMLNTVLTRGSPDARPMDAHAWLALQDVQMHAQRTFDSAFEGVDILLAPVFGRTAFPLFGEGPWSERTLEIGGRAERYGDQLAFAGLATFPGLPATAIPVGRGPDGLPIGLQAISATAADRTTLGFALRLEAAGLTMPAFVG